MPTRPEPSQPPFAFVDDGAVLAALRNGDEDAFGMMVDRYHLSLLRVATSIVHDRAVAEDVAQDAWLGLLESLPRFEGRSSIRTWLFHILVNCARARIRREQRILPFSDAGMDGDAEPLVDPGRFLAAGNRWAGHWADPPEAWPEEHALDEELTSLLLEAVAVLPGHQRMVVTLRDIEGWTGAEVCAVLEITEGNQRVLLHRARSRIRNEIEHYVRGDQEGGQGDDSSR